MEYQAYRQRMLAEKIDPVPWLLDAAESVAGSRP
jgi:hypothetical protein